MRFNMTIEQLNALAKKVASKKYPSTCANTKDHTWRSEQIINKLTNFERELRIKEGRYCNGR